jgi:hypothetical protein
MNKTIISLIIVKEHTGGLSPGGCGGGGSGGDGMMEVLKKLRAS